MKKLRMQDVEARMTNHAKESVFAAFGIMKGVTLAAAGATLLSILDQALKGDLSALMKVPIWGASVWLAWLTFNNMTVFSNLLSYEMDGAHTAILFVKTIIEFLLFAVLAYGKAWYVWPILHGLIAGLAFIKIRRYLANLRDERYEPALYPLLCWLRSWARQRDLQGTFGSSVFFLTCGSIIITLYLTSAVSPEVTGLLTYFVSVISFIPLWIGSKSGETIRRKILATLDSQPDENCISEPCTDAENAVRFESSSVVAFSEAASQMNVLEQQRKAATNPGIVPSVLSPEEHLKKAGELPVEVEKLNDYLGKR